MTIRTRFAPSPTGPLHLGHAFAAFVAFDMAQAHGGQCLLRIEDIDQTRARPEWEAQILDDLQWLGLSWPHPVLRQSDNINSYSQAIEKLWNMGLLYSCRCNRRDIAQAASAPQEGAPMLGPDGIVYPGTCRPDAPPADSRPRDCALRLDMARAMDCLGPVSFTETGSGPEGQSGQVTLTPESACATIGDVVIARRDFGTSYHLSVVVDDAAQSITHVTRGHDLFSATPIHVLLQRLLGLPTPVYHHHRLIRDDTGKRLAKRDDARAIATFRADGASPQDIRRMVGS